MTEATKDRKISVRLDDASKVFWENGRHHQHEILREAMHYFAEINRIQSDSREITLVSNATGCKQTYVFDPAFGGDELRPSIKIEVDESIADCIRSIQRNYKALTKVPVSTIIRNALICYRELKPRIDYGYRIENFRIAEVDNGSAARPAHDTVSRTLRDRPTSFFRHVSSLKNRPEAKKLLHEKAR